LKVIETLNSRDEANVIVFRGGSETDLVDAGATTLQCHSEQLLKMTEENGAILKAFVKEATAGTLLRSVYQNGCCICIQRWMAAVLVGALMWSRMAAARGQLDRWMYARWCEASIHVIQYHNSRDVHLLTHRCLHDVASTATTSDAAVYGARLSTEIRARGCHWFTHLLD